MPNPVTSIPALAELLRTDVLAAAPALLGWHLVAADGAVAQIIETEAYRGEDDAGCHAYGKTRMKNMALWGEPGRAYVYFTYGHHWMLNVAAHEIGRAAGILIRAARPISGADRLAARRPGRTEREWLAGPGRLAQAFGITGADNEINLLAPNGRIWLSPGASVVRIGVDLRIGLAEGKGDDLPWRFVDLDSRAWLSRGLSKNGYERLSGRDV